MQSTADIFIFSNGTEFEIHRTTKETNGAYLEMEMTIVPDDSSTPVHIHPSQEEEYKVLHGIFDIYMNGIWKRYHAGEIITIPAGVPHTFRNSSAKTVKVMNYHKPALSFEQYIRTIGHLIMTGKITDRKFASMVYLAMVWKRHNDTIRAVGTMRILMSVLAFWGELRGYDIDE